MIEFLTCDNIYHIIVFSFVYLLTLLETYSLKLSLILNRDKKTALLLAHGSILLWLWILILPIASVIFHVYHGHTYSGTLLHLRILASIMVLICVWLVAEDFPYKRLITVALFLSCIDFLGLPPLFIALILMFHRGIGLQIYLQRERNLLKVQKDNIGAMLAALENSHKEETAYNLHSDLHDVMGRNLGAIQQILRDKQVDYTKLYPLLSKLVQGLPVESMQNANTILIGLLHTYKTIGLEVIFQGTLPDDERIAQVFVKLISESVNNALRHGKASKVNIYISNENRPQITITNDGIIQNTNPSPGKGLQGIKKDLARMGYTLEVLLSPQFTIIGRFRKQDD